MTRRNFAQLSVAAGFFSFLPIGHTKSNVNGKLLIIGGAEDRINERVILKRFIELSGGNQAKLKFILAASSEPSSVWASYSNVFKNLGATDVEPIALLSREDAYNPDVVSNLLTADGIFMTGGDQSRSSYHVKVYRSEEKRIASLLNAINYLVLPGPARI